MLKAFRFIVETFEVVKSCFIYQRQEQNRSAHVCAQYFHDSGAGMVEFKRK